MFKLCIAFVVIGCAATLIEGQVYNPYFRQAYNPYFQQSQYQPFRYQQPRFQFLNQQRPVYYNPNAYNRNFLNNYYNRPIAGVVPQRVYSNEGLARTISQAKYSRPDGSYEYSYQTENGIRGEERNIPKQTVRSAEPSPNAEGSYGYTSPEGLKVVVNYQADEDGFRPVLSYGGNGVGQFISQPEPSSVVINKNQVVQ